jgi:hypothetical protein
MKRTQIAWILTAAVALTVCPASGYAQEAASSAATTGAADTPPTKNIQLVGARASLSKGLDAKKAKQGDAVTAKLQDDVKIPDSVELPKNTVLVGHVDQVQPSQNKSDSTVQVTFDKAQLKNGQQLPIKATIMQIAPPANAIAMNQAGGADSGGGGMPSAPAASSGGGGGAGGSMQSAQPRPSTSPTMGSGSPDQPQQQGSQPGMTDVALQSDIHQSNSGTFTSKGKNVRLPDGTQLQFAVAVIPANTQIK